MEKSPSLDELNRLYNKYFEIMNITQEQKLERIELAEMLDDMFIFLFGYINTAIGAGVINPEEFYEVGKQRYTDLLKSYGVNFDKYPDMETYVNKTVEEIVDSTINNPKRDVYIRAIECAEDQSNSVFNYIEYTDAVNEGRKYKVWMCESDLKVRPTHEDVDLMRLPIDEPFLVGESQMMFPKDTSLGADASEIINCRCSIIYS